MNVKSDPRTRGSSVTIREVARHAQVSEMTVSRALRGTGYVSSATRARVLESARHFGYVRNGIAGALASQRTNLVGIVVPSITNSVYADVLAGIAHGLLGSPLQPVFGVTDYLPETEERLIADMLSWRPSGLVVAGLAHTRAARRMLAGTHLPVAEIMDTEGRPVEYCVGLSQREAGHLIGRHLIERGYRRIAYVAHNHELDVTARKRHAGFLQALEQAGMTTTHSIIDNQPSSFLLGRQLTAQVLASSARIDAICYSNDDMAIGGLMHCIAEGVQVPGDVALAGYSGVALNAALPQRLTTVISPRFEIGMHAARYVLTRLDADRPTRPIREVLPLKLVCGDTT